MIQRFLQTQYQDFSPTTDQSANSNSLQADNGDDATWIFGGFCAIMIIVACCAASCSQNRMRERAQQMHQQHIEHYRRLNPDQPIFTYPYRYNGNSDQDSNYRPPNIPHYGPQYGHYYAPQYVRQYGPHYAPQYGPHFIHPHPVYYAPPNQIPQSDSVISQDSILKPSTPQKQEYPDINKVANATNSNQQMYFNNIQNQVPPSNPSRRQDNGVKNQTIKGGDI